ncbi:hypothetical protein [Dactylosporangium salmoneum]|uniref:Uncharacterized protein n=1 Tax=Dactylosporangium salmoneum TaxID=53361 RepID=A0ABP5TMT5_9ACTN
MGQPNPEADTAGWKKLFAALREPTWLLVTSATAAAAGGATPSLPGLARDCPVDRPAADTLGLGDDGWVLVRPDGYTAARGHGQDQLDRAYRRLPL